MGEQKSPDTKKEGKDIYDILHGLLTGFLIPFAIYLLAEINTGKKELSDFKVTVAQEMGNRVLKSDLERLENKIDDLRNLVISELIKKK